MTLSPQDPIVFVAAKRTAFGTYLGALKKLTATDLGVLASKAAIAQAGVSTSLIDSVVFGNVMQTSADAIYLARHIGLRCELPQSTPALTVNRLCGSGFEAIAQAAALLAMGDAKCVLAGGTESMSQAPHIVRGARDGLALGDQKFEDSLWSALTDSYTGMPMAITAENLAVKYEISQDEVDVFSIRSQQQWQKAQEAGAFKDEIVPVELKKRKEVVSFEVDEHPRPQTTLEALKKLPKIFKKDGTIHAGAASGICDGAAALILCKTSFAKEHNLQPLGRLLSVASAGCDPTIMGIGPVPAAKIALTKAGLSLDDMDLIEVNEAFSPQALAVQKELNIPENKFNQDGGAIAIGHPLAASGARITGHLLYALKQRGLKKALGSACIGGGQGMALIVEAF